MPPPAALRNAPRSLPRRLAVHDATSGIQIPWDTSSLITDVSFFPRAAGAAPAQPAGAAAVAGAVPLATRPTQATLRSMSPADAYRTAIAWDRRDIYRSALDLNPDDQNALRLHRILAQRTEETAWAETVLAGAPDITKGALFFHSARVAPGWFASRPRVGRFGGNVFYR